jgi:hypothetical protein
MRHVARQGSDGAMFFLYVLLVAPRADPSATWTCCRHGLNAFFSTFGMGVMVLEATPLRVFNINNRLCIIPACLS